MTRRSDSNVPFDDLCVLLTRLGFERRVRGDHYIFTTIIFWSEDDSSYVAEVPELPGCMADGPTYQEALSNAEQIIREWIETASDLS